MIYTALKVRRLDLLSTPWLKHRIGKLPDCRMSFCKGFTQGGSNADVVIADAFIKNIEEGIDWKTAYEAVVSDAEGRP